MSVALFKRILFLLFFLPAVLPADRYIDSLVRRHAALPTDSQKVFNLIRIAIHLRQIAADTTEEFYYDIVRQAEEAGCALCHAEALTTLATREIDHGDYKSATEHVISALRSAERSGDKSAVGRAYNSLAEVYAYQDLYAKAKEYFEKAAAIFTEEKQESHLAVIYMNLANIEYASAGKTGDFSKVVELYQRSAAIHRKRNSIANLVGVNGNLANAYIDVREFQKAHLLLDSTLALCDKHGLKAERLNMFYYRGRVFAEENKIRESRESLQKALALAEEFENPMMTSEILVYLGWGYESEGDFKNALKHFKRSFQIKDSLFKSENTRQLNEMAARFESDKKDLQLRNKDEKLAKQKTILFSSVAGTVLLLLLLIVFFSRARIKQKANEKLEKAYHVIEEKNKDITDSINYAKKIQQAILPHEHQLTKLFPASFVFFRPRDIVSGDFYWLAEKNNCRFFAVADCTGHGVPGSMMSMIGNALLNQFVLEKGITDPAVILNSMRDEIIRSLKQSGETGAAKDGMDISLCVFFEDNKRRFIDFAGANNSLYLARNNEIILYKADRFPVAITAGEIKPFSSTRIEAEPGGTVYMVTDGFADQFGGPKGKKFKYHQLQQTFISIAGRTPADQCKILSAVFDSWKGDLDQVDDVCVAGIKL